MPEWVRLGAVTESRYQPRLAGEPDDGDESDDKDLDGLVASIRADTLLARPQVRPHPDDPARYEIVAGHRRVAALRRLAAALLAEGATHPVLRLGATVDDTEIPVLVALADDGTALWRIIVENAARRPLRGWEDVVAVAEYHEQQLAAGDPAGGSVRRDAAALGYKRGTMERLRRIALGVTPAVLHAAGVLPDAAGSRRDAAPARMRRLTLEELDRIAKRRSLSERAEALRAALRAAADDNTSEPDPDGSFGADQTPASSDCGPGGDGAPAPAAAPPGSGSPDTEAEPARGAGGLYVDIRTPVAALSAAAALRHTRRIACRFAEIVERAGDSLTTEDRSMLAALGARLQVLATAAPDRNE